MQLLFDRTGGNSSQGKNLCQGDPRLLPNLECRQVPVKREGYCVRFINGNWKCEMCVCGGGGGLPPPKLEMVEDLKSESRT